MALSCNAVLWLGKEVVYGEVVQFVDAVVIDCCPLGGCSVRPLLVGGRSALVCGTALSSTDVSAHVGIGNVRQLCAVLRIISGR